VTAAARADLAREKAATSTDVVTLDPCLPDVTIAEKTEDRLLLVVNTETTMKTEEAETAGVDAVDVMVDVTVDVMVDVMVTVMPVASVTSHAALVTAEVPPDMRDVKKETSREDGLLATTADSSTTIETTESLSDVPLPATTVINPSAEFTSSC